MKKINLTKYSGDTTFNELDAIKWDMRSIVRQFHVTEDTAADQWILYNMLAVVLEKYVLDEESTDE